MAVTVRGLAPIARAGALMLGGLGVLALYALAIWHAPEFLINQDLLAKAVPEQRLSAEHNARLIVISVGGALVVGTGLLYTARNYRLAHRGQVTERFTKALERLGSDELYVRIGGVHALQHVMRDSPEHHGDVVEVLVAFIRDRVPRKVAESADETRWMHPPSGTDEPELPTEPAPDVQAAFTALSSRPKRIEHERVALNFRQLHIRGVRLNGAQFKGADLSEANLENADLSEANLQNANLSEANLQNADLIVANLQNANLRDANLQNADLIGANLQNARLTRAKLQNGNLVGANLQNAILIRAKLQNADLVGANLQNANLSGADLSLAALRAGQLHQAVVSRLTALPEGLMRDRLGEIWEKDLT